MNSKFLTSIFLKMTLDRLRQNVDKNTPEVSVAWRLEPKLDQIKKITEVLMGNPYMEKLQLEDCTPEGMIYFSEIAPIPVSERADTLLDLEMILKSEIDEGLTIWIKPQGDKNSLRRLRGVKVKVL
jgi:hypothetical protein